MRLLTKLKNLEVSILTKLGDIFKAKEQQDMPEEYYEEYPEGEFQPEPQMSPEQEIRRRAREEEVEEDDTSPLSIVNEIREKPSPKGTHKTVIGGVPVDLHVLEEYLVKTSPFALKTVMRYHNARNMEEIKNYSKGMAASDKTKMIIFIVLAIGIAGLGIFVMMFLPQILQAFQGGI